MEQLQPKLGKALLVIHFIVLFVAVVILPPTVVAFQGVDLVASPKFRQSMAFGMAMFALFGSLGYLMWMGFGWARYTAAFMLFGGGVFSVTFLDSYKGLAHTFVIAIILLCLLVAAGLSFFKPIDDFIRDQERMRRLNR